MARQGLTGVIQKLAERFLIGRDPRPVEAISALLYAATRQAAGGVNQMAIAAIENALVDIKAKALGVPVYEMLGGPVRDRLQLYWSHCGTYRAVMPTRSRNGRVDRCAHWTTSSRSARGRAPGRRASRRPARPMPSP